MKQLLIASTVTLLIDFVLRGAKKQKNQRQKRRFYVQFWRGYGSWQCDIASLAATSNEYKGNLSLMNSFLSLRRLNEKR